MLESLGKLCDILIGKERNEVGWFGRITAQNVNRRLVLEDTRDLVAGQEDRNAPVIAGHPFDELLLRMGVGSIHLVQEQTHGLGILAHEGSNAASVPTGLR